MQYRMCAQDQWEFFAYRTRDPKMYDAITATTVQRALPKLADKFEISTFYSGFCEWMNLRWNRLNALSDQQIQEMAKGEMMHYLVLASDLSPQQRQDWLTVLDGKYQAMSPAVQAAMVQRQRP